MNIYAWWTACRPNTLIISISPVLLGLSLSIHNNNFSSILVALLTLIAAVLIQIGTNFINDLYDFISGADTENRLGPIRATQSGLLSKKEIKAGAFFCFMLARLNQDDVSLDLLFIEIQNKLGLVILISFLAGALLTFVLEILYSLRKNKGD